MHKRLSPDMQQSFWDERKKPKKRADSAHVETLTIGDLRPFMHLTLEQAATELSIGTTVLKRIARKCGIPKWPSRQITWLNQKIEGLSEEMARLSASEQSNMQVQLQKLLDAKRAVYNTGKVPTGFIKNWAGKHVSDDNTTEDEGTSELDDGYYFTPESKTTVDPVELPDVYVDGIDLEEFDQILQCWSNEMLFNFEL